MRSNQSSATSTTHKSHASHAPCEQCSHGARDACGLRVAVMADATASLCNSCKMLHNDAVEFTIRRHNDSRTAR
eukprot:11190845-Lingulodinium_polyedra.AAC.1